MDLQLSGLSAVVTGGSAGIGAAIVRVLAQEGCRVAFCARGAAGVRAMLDSVSGLPGEVSAVALDVTDTAVLQAWLESVGAVDIFIPNVSALSSDWQSALATDLHATVRATEAAVPFLLQSHCAAITYIGSKASSLALPNVAAYGAAKAAAVHYMKSLSSRLLPKVRVNTVSPGDTFVPGGFWDKVQARDAELFERTLRGNPMKRLATPEEIARVVAFISSPVASFVAGTNWYVDGGSVNHTQY